MSRDPEEVNKLTESTYKVSERETGIRRTAVEQQFNRCKKELLLVSRARAMSAFGLCCCYREELLDSSKSRIAHWRHRSKARQDLFLWNGYALCYS